jgi:hypothetical protein
MIMAMDTIITLDIRTKTQPADTQRHATLASYRRTAYVAAKTRDTLSFLPDTFACAGFRAKYFRFLIAFSA